MPGKLKVGALYILRYTSCHKSLKEKTQGFAKE